MSKLARPGFSRLKAPTYSKNRPSDVIVTPTGDGIETSQTVSSDAPSQQIPSGIATQQVRPSLKKPENVAAQPKVARPVSNSKISKSSSKLATNRNVQHGTGPYERAKQPSSTIPYVGKKRPAGVLKSPDSKGTAISKPYLTNGTAKHNETIIVESKATKEKGKPSMKPSENGMHAMPRALKRTSLPMGKSQASTDLMKPDNNRRQTISTPAKSNSKLSFSKNSTAIRPRSSCTSDLNKTDTKRNMSKSLQCLPKAVTDGSTPPPMNKPLSKKELSQKSVSHDDILSCSKKELKKPIAGVLPRSKSGLPSSKFGFSRGVVEKPRASSTNSVLNTVSTPQSHVNVNHIDHQLSPIIGTPASVRAVSLEETFSKVSQVPSNDNTCNINVSKQSYQSPPAASNKVDGMNQGVNVTSVLDMGNSISSGDNSNDTKQINIIINLDTVTSSEPINTTATLSKNDAALNESLFNKDCEDICSTARSRREMNDRTFDKSSSFDKDRSSMLYGKTFNKTRSPNSSGSDILNKTQTIAKHDLGGYDKPNEVLNKTFDKDCKNISPISRSYGSKDRTFNKTKSLDNSGSHILNETQTIDTENWNEPNPVLNTTRTFNKNSGDLSNRTYETHDRTFNKSKSLDNSGSRILNRTQTIESDDIENFNQTRVLPNDSLDKSDSGFDDTTNFLNISDIPPCISELSPLNNSKSMCVEKRDMTMDGELSEDVLKVIAAISSNINRSCSTATFTQSPIKHDKDLKAPHKSDYMYYLSKDISMNTTNWLDDSVGLKGPALEDTMHTSQPASLSPELDEYNNRYESDDLISKSSSRPSSLSQELDEYKSRYEIEDLISKSTNSRYETDDLISKSTIIDMSEVSTPDSVGLNLNGPTLESIIHTSQTPKSLSQELGEYNSRYETDDLISKSTNSRYETDDLISKSTTIDISEVASSKQFHDTEDISHCTDISQSTEKYRSHLSSIGTDSDGVEDMDLLPINENSIVLNEYINDCYCKINGEEISEFSGLNGIHNSLNLKKDSVGSDVPDGVLCDSGHCTDMNDNEVNLDITNKLTISDVRTDLFTSSDAFIVRCDKEYTDDSDKVFTDGSDKLFTDGSDKAFTDGSDKACPSTPPNESASSVSSDTTCPSTPLSRQGSLEYDLTRRCNTVATTRRIKKVARSRTYSSSELITKFRVPKEPKCVETSDGDILMDKTTFLHFMNEVKLVKTSLLKLKRTLVEAPCASPLLNSPLKRSTSAVEASAVPPLSPRTCQCSPMAVVNPLVLRTGSTSSPSKEKEIVYTSEEEKLQDFASTIKILQTQLESCDQKQQDLIEENILLRSLQENSEQKQQDIIEENILLREEISHLTERLRKSRDSESGTAEDRHGSVEDTDLDLDSRLPIIQRMYSDGQ